MKKPFTLERYMVVRDLRFSLHLFFRSSSLAAPIIGREEDGDGSVRSYARERKGVATRTKSRCVVVANRDKV